MEHFWVRTVLYVQGMGCAVNEMLLNTVQRACTQIILNTPFYYSVISKSCSVRHGIGWSWPPYRHTLFMSIFRNIVCGVFETVMSIALIIDISQITREWCVQGNRKCAYGYCEAYRANCVDWGHIGQGQRQCWTYWHLQLGPIGCPETSLTSYQSTFCSILEEENP